MNQTVVSAEESLVGRQSDWGMNDLLLGINLVVQPHDRFSQVISFYIEFDVHVEIKTYSFTIVLI